jgi:hypothetical protein
MPYDEEREEDRINALPRSQREKAQPDGMSSPPELAPQRVNAPVGCEHPRLRMLPDILNTILVCMDCGAQMKGFPERKP